MGEEIYKLFAKIREKRRAAKPFLYLQTGLLPRGIDETNGLFRRNSGCSAERNLSEYRGTKIEANFRNFVPKHFAEEKTSRNFIPWNKNKSKLSEFCSEAFFR
jgi:hypothetical protein